MSLMRYVSWCVGEQICLHCWSEGIGVPEGVIQVAQLWQRDRATAVCCAYVWKVHCAVVGTASGSVQSRPGTRDAVAIRQARKTRTDWPGRHNNLNRHAPGRLCTEHEPMSRSKSAFCEGGGPLSANISQERGRRPPTTVGVRKLRVIFLSCGIKIYTVHYFVLSQYTHLTDRRTGLRQQYRALHYMQSRG